MTRMNETMTMMSKGQQDHIDLQEVLKILKKWRTFIVLVVVLTTLLAYLVNAFMLKPVYASSTQLIVNTKQSNQNSMLTNADLQLSLNLIETYKEVLMSPRILDKVIKDYQFPYTVSELQKKISVRTVKLSQVISLTVEDRSPEQAALIANAVATTFQKEIPLIMSVDNVQILAEATPNLKPVKPRVFMNVLLSMLVSLLLSIVVVFIKEFLDQTFTPPILRNYSVHLLCENSWRICMNNSTMYWSIVHRFFLPLMRKCYPDSLMVSSSLLRLPQRRKNTC